MAVKMAFVCEYANIMIEKYDKNYLQIHQKYFSCITRHAHNVAGAHWNALNWVRIPQRQLNYVQEIQENITI